jgi:hypothetical protein
MKELTKSEYKVMRIFWNEKGQKGAVCRSHTGA